jgi:signal peptidase II
MNTETTKIHISKKTVTFIVLAVFFVVLDRFLEALCLHGYFDHPVTIIGDIFTLSYVKNYYIAFSLPFSGPILTALIGIIILTLLIYWLKLVFFTNLKFRTSNIGYALTILIIGAILNFTDRIKFGFVIDYFYLKYFTIFNLADIMIVGGVIFLIVPNLKNYEHGENNNTIGKKGV